MGDRERNDSGRRLTVHGLRKDSHDICHVMSRLCHQYAFIQLEAVDSVWNRRETTKWSSTVRSLFGKSSRTPTLTGLTNFSELPCWYNGSHLMPNFNPNLSAVGPVLQRPTEHWSQHTGTLSSLLISSYDSPCCGLDWTCHPFLGSLSNAQNSGRDPCVSFG